MSETIADALDIEYTELPKENTKPVAVITVPPELPVVATHAPLVINEDQDADYKLSRNTLRTIITKGSTAIDNISQLAKDLESPRAYEVLATMMKTIAETTKDLYGLQGETKALAEPQTQGQTPINVEKAVFVGTPSELLKQLKDNGNQSQ